MLWYVPSWNGDIRFESTSEGDTVVTVIKPTAAELTKIIAIERVFAGRGWIEGGLWSADRNTDVQSTIVKAPLIEVGKRILASYTQGDAVLTAIRFENDEVKVLESGAGFWRKIAEAFHMAGERVVQASDELAAAQGDGSPHRQEATAQTSADPGKDEKAAKKAEAKAAATVKKPTSCCPTCFEGPMEPAKEVLFAFLSDDEKAQWADDHAIVVTGGYTGCEYLLSHRNGRWATRFGKICRDLDHQVTLHFHDNTVPPEEEVLAAKLILEHREDWLRHEASYFGDGPKFKNPFGDSLDGTRSASFTSGFADGILLAMPALRNIDLDH